ncbi:MAG: RNA polymerase sigma factor SigK [Phycisphaeraceae bacterium]|nr:MAG: RNA polymerase sigma factor SigK [Phycisphaeraceae bacterium]
MPTILQRIADGDESAIRDCLTEYGDLVWRLAMRYLRVPADAEDATQEVFVSLWLTARRFDPAKGSEPAWVATIAHRRLTDYTRSPAARRSVSTEQVVSASGGGELAPNSWTGQDDAIVRAFRELTGEEREALWLSIVAGMSHTQIGAVLDVPVGTVKTRLRRGIRRLREHVLGPVGVGGKGGVL